MKVEMKLINKQPTSYQALDNVQQKNEKISPNKYIWRKAHIPLALQSASCQQNISSYLLQSVC